MKRIILISSLVLLVTACDDGFADMNVNPSAASQIKAEYKFTAMQLQTAGGRYESWRANLIYCSTMMQHFAATAGYWTGDKYTLNEGYSASLMDRYYGAPVKSVEDILNQLTTEDGTPDQIAMTRIMRVVIYHRLTDLHGDIPYSEAGKGYLEGILTPKYDAQKDIYADMLKELDEAASQLGSGTSAFGNNDIMYHGDLSQWKKFAYSMMLRLGLRMIKVDPTSAKAWVDKAIAGGVMTSSDDIAYIQHTDGPDGMNRNGNGEVFAADGNMRISKTFMDFLEGDPRQSILCSLPATGVYKGLPNGYDSNTLNAATGEENLDNYSGPNRTAGTGITGKDDPMFFQTYAEVEFMLAEAAVRWGGDAESHYNAGVTAAMKYLTLYGAPEISDADITAYLTANPYDASKGLEMINTQYWAATFLNEYESFANWRRTGIPALTPVNYPGNVTNGTIPRRMIYSPSERSGNTDNYNAAVAAQGPDELTTRVWWDK